jgi:hypothetical protein
MNRRSLLQRLGAVGLAAVAAPLLTQIPYEPTRSYFFGGWRPTDSQYEAVLLNEFYDEIRLPIWNSQARYVATSDESIYDAAMFDKRSGLYVPHDKPFGPPTHLVNGDSFTVTWKLNLAS